MSISFFFLFLMITPQTRPYKNIIVLKEIFSQTILKSFVQIVLFSKWGCTNSLYQVSKLTFSIRDGNILIGTSWEAQLHWNSVRRAVSLQQQHQPHQNPLMNLASDISLVFTLVQRWSRNNSKQYFISRHVYSLVRVNEHLTVSPWLLAYP